MYFLCSVQEYRRKSKPGFYLALDKDESQHGRVELAGEDRQRQNELVGLQLSPQHRTRSSKAPERPRATAVRGDEESRVLAGGVGE